MRAKKIALFCAIIVVIFVCVYCLQFLGDQHRHIDTAGDIVFASDMGSPGHAHIFLIKPGDAPKQLTRGNFSDIDPSFSPDGSQLTFVSDRTGAQQVYVMDSDGLNPQAYSIGTDSKSDPKFAPDGRLVAYLTRGTLSVVDTVGGKSTIVLPQSPSLTSSNSTELAKAIRSAVIAFAWSPTTDPRNEQLSAVQQNQDGDKQTVALVAADGGNPAVLVEAPTISDAWSPDGSKIAIAAIGVSTASGVASGIAAYGDNGKPIPQAPIVALPGSEAGPQSPQYSPDGSAIVFEVAQQTKLGVFAPQAILRTPSAPESRPSLLIKGGGHDPKYSPDGSRLIFLAPSAKDANQQDLYVLDLATNQAIDLTGGQGDVTSANWSPTLAPAAK